MIKFLILKQMYIINIINKETSNMKSLKIVLNKEETG